MGQLPPGNSCLLFILVEKDGNGVGKWYFRGTLLVAQLVEALRYSSEGRGFGSRWCHWNFSLT